MGFFRGDFPTVSTTYHSNLTVAKTKRDTAEVRRKYLAINLVFSMVLQIVLHEYIRISRTCSHIRGALARGLRFIMAQDGYQTNIASEFYVMSVLHRLGLDAHLILGNKKSVDIVVVHGPGDSVTIDVKAVAGRNDWPMANVSTEPRSHRYSVKNHTALFPFGCKSCNWNFYENNPTRPSKIQRISLGK